jgi:hypothetical protein
MREALRHLRIIAGVLIVVVALHQIGSELVSCLMGLSPDPIVCNQPEVALPHTDNERPAPGQVLDKAPFAIVTSATSVTPCFNPGPKHHPQDWYATRSGVSRRVFSAWPLSGRSAATQDYADAEHKAEIVPSTAIGECVHPNVRKDFGDQRKRWNEPMEKPPQKSGRLNGWWRRLSGASRKHYGGGYNENAIFCKTHMPSVLHGLSFVGYYMRVRTVRMSESLTTVDTTWPPKRTRKVLVGIFLIPFFTGILNYQFLSNEYYDEKRHDLLESHERCQDVPYRCADIADLWRDKKTGEIFSRDDFAAHTRDEATRIAIVSFAYGLIGCFALVILIGGKVSTHFSST